MAVVGVDVNDTCDGDVGLTLLLTELRGGCEVDIPSHSPEEQFLGASVAVSDAAKHRSSGQQTLILACV